MKLQHSKNNIRTQSRFFSQIPTIFAFLVITILSTVEAEAQILDFTIVQGFDVSESVPVPHVFCHNATPNFEEYARSDVYDGLGANPAYTRWRCWANNLRGLQTQPSAGDWIEQKIHGKSDGLDPEVSITSTLAVHEIICRNTDAGDRTIATQNAAGDWVCNLPSLGYTLSPGDDLIVKIKGTY